ncbi:hypothetical protein AWZ03_010244 [Drosophila navojoa]|uniref:Uncharacterized protein n=1 Tax=Drosophila navojoa TaxID=7232 RepID=A0A484B686_DRONA|nr:hypothetical protein AWZ03_010244 [Drosophila navojoa]
MPCPCSCPCPLSQQLAKQLPDPPPRSTQRSALLEPLDTLGLIQFIHLAWRRFGLAHCHAWRMWSESGVLCQDMPQSVVEPAAAAAAAAAATLAAEAAAEAKAGHVCQPVLRLDQSNQARERQPTTGQLPNTKTQQSAAVNSNNKANNNSNNKNSRYGSSCPLCPAIIKGNNIFKQR